MEQICVFSGDPVNRVDPSGMDDVCPVDFCVTGTGIPPSDPPPDEVGEDDLDVASGPRAVLSPSPMSKARMRLDAASEGILDTGNVSDRCQKDLDALSNQTIDLTAIQNAVLNTNFVNGTTDPQYKNAFTPKEIPDPTNPNGPKLTSHVTATTPINGHTIYIDPAAIGNNVVFNEGFLMYEDRRRTWYGRLGHRCGSPLDR